MKNFILINLIGLLTITGTRAQSNHLVISQVYASGGNANAVFTHDFVELFNPTTTTVSLSGLSLQYAGFSAASWSRLNLTGTILPGQFFLVQLGAGGSVGKALPSADQSASFGLSASSGIIALLNSIITVPANSCPSAVVDMIGYGLNAVCREGTAAPSPLPGEGLLRMDNGCKDQDDNGIDFISVAPSPANSSSPIHLCSNGSVTIDALSDQPLCINDTAPAATRLGFRSTGFFSNSEFWVYLSDVNGSFTASTIVGSVIVSGTDPAGTIAVTIPQGLTSGKNYLFRIYVSNLSFYSERSDAIEIVNGAANTSHLVTIPSIRGLSLQWTNPAGCYDEVMVVAKLNAPVNGLPTGDGSAYNADSDFAGSGTLFDGGRVVYKGTGGKAGITGLESYQAYFLKVFSRRGNSWSSGVEVSDFPRYIAAPGEIVINQVSPDYGAASDEYVELVNTTDKIFYLSDLAFAYQSATGTSKISAFLAGVLPPHRYWLLSPNPSITAGKTAGITRDGSINPGLALNAQIAIVTKAGNVIVDALAYGNVTAGEYIEGSPANAPTMDGGLKRRVEGLDNNNNSNDFVQVNTTDIELSNSKSILANVGAIIPGGDYVKLYVTGIASLSGAVSVSDKVSLISGMLSLSDHDLSVDSVAGGNSACYIKTNGSGTLLVNLIEAEPKNFPIGNSTYNPITISNGSGLNWKARVQDTLQDVTHNKSVRRTWHISSSSPPTAGANLQFTYNDGDAGQVTTSFDPNEDVYIWNNHNNNWQIAGIALSPAGTSGGSRTVALKNWSQFSPFIITNVTGALPVHFDNEKVSLRANEVMVSWSNLTENNVRVYEVERAPDAIHFTKFAELVPIKNNGQSADYSYTDNSQFTGRLYYRIKAVELDGSTEYSKIISLDTGERLPRLLIYPNPARRGIVNLHSKNLPSGTYSIYILNAAGQQIGAEKIYHHRGWPDKSLLLNNLRRGHYLLRLEGPVFLRQWFMVE